MKIINLGILAHVDAGKTTLTESLLYTSGAIAELGSVDEGTTRTDTMNLERQRGITIQTAVTSFQWEDVKVNIIDVDEKMRATVFSTSGQLDSFGQIIGGPIVGLVAQQVSIPWGLVCTAFLLLPALFLVPVAGKKRD